MVKRYYAVLDFEANCTSDNTRDHEIIEAPIVLIDAESGEVVDEFRHFVQTVFTGDISPFIQELTGITTEQMRSGVKWYRCLELMEEFCEKHELTAENTTFVTCGNWDLKTMLVRQMLITKTKLTPRLNTLFSRWSNIKIHFKRTFRTNPGGMAKMLHTLGIELVGRHHSGIDDCRNIASICRAVQAKGCDITEPTSIRDRLFWYETEAPFRRAKSGRIIPKDIQ